MVKSTLSEGSMSSDDQILLPMCGILPANQIITKNYDLDQDPIIKFIPNQSSKERTQYNNYQINQSAKISNLQMAGYADSFSQNDFLGRFYANMMDQIVYLKFNNKDYNTLKVGQRKSRFFAGCFVQPQHFSQVAYQKSDNIMKTLPYVDFVDYNQHILQSFGKNARGFAFDPKFSSNYDSANLFAVIRKRQFQYDLILQNDMNSKGNTQWFNFLVNFTEQGQYKFNIVNFTKSHSLYQQGMRIACYSFLKQSNRGIFQNHKAGAGWFRTGKNIRYFRNDIQRQTLNSNESYYTLSFDYHCKNRSQSIIFAHSYPYSGLDLQRFFNKMMYRRVSGHLKMQKITICNSVSGQPINGYIISYRKIRSGSFNFKNDFTTSQNVEKRLSNASKLLPASPSNLLQQAAPLKSIVLMGRQHSGETQSSYMLQGIVEGLMTNSQLDQIKKNYLIFVFPIINIDGVKYGHYRTNLTGTDLNRVWRNPKKQLHPQVYHLKKFMFEVNRTNPISLILDIHGHSKSMNTFFYGNPSKKQNSNLQDAKIFPYMCSKRIRQISYKQSTFSIKQDKKSSARVVLNQMFPKALVYTIQNSFYGYQAKKQTQSQQNPVQKPQIVEFTPEGYRKVGRQLITTYLEYTRLCEKNNSVKLKWIKQIQTVCIDLERKSSKQLSDDGGSDSQIENQLIQVAQSGLSQKKTFQDLSIYRPSIKIQSIKNNIFQPKNYVLRRNDHKQTMLLPRTICDQNVRGVTSVNFRTLTNLTQFSQAKQQNQKKQLVNKCGQKPFTKYSQTRAVLSVFKIQTQKNQLMKKKTNNMLKAQQNSQRNTFINMKEKRIDSQSNLFTQIKLKQKSLNVEEALQKCNGMKTFFKAMGMTIQNRKS